FSNIAEISSTITEQNKARITKAFDAYNKANPTSVTQKSNANIESALAYLAKANADTNQIDISNMISAANTLKTNYQAYTTNNSNITELKKYQLNTQGSMTDAQYVQYLQNNVNTSIATKKFSECTGTVVDGTVTQTPEQEYIVDVQTKYYNSMLSNSTLKTIFSSDWLASLTSVSASDFNTTIGKINSKITELNSTIETEKTEMLNQLKILDTSTTQLPLALSSVVNYWSEQAKILSAISNVEYLKDPTVSQSDMKTSSSDITYKYSSALKDYIMNLKDDTNNIEFLASDFKKDESARAYVASKETSTVLDNAYVWMPNLQNYLTSGGSQSSETEARRLEALSIFNAIKNGNATSIQKETFKTWADGYIDLDNIQNQSSTDYQSLTKAIDILSSPKNCSFALQSTKKISNIVYLGGNYAKLSFSDFGIYDKKTEVIYNGNSNVLSASGYSSSTTSDNITSFFSGLESFKQAYVADLTKTDTDKITFTGNTIAYAKLDGTNTSQFLTGNATLNIYKRNVTGDLKLSFDKFYGFTISGIDLSNKDFSTTNTPVISTSCDSCGWITSDKSFTSTISGAQYGLDQNTPIEAVGSYSFTTPDVNTTKFPTATSATITGAFGVKK
ncbi:MAG: hypothetical protein IJ638_01655, partial [Alphaproteobacteria bacterium]|nr:hypothetical protein [Alphaproteobacteria bacterium]